MLLSLFFASKLGWLPIPGSEMPFIYLFEKEYLPVPHPAFIVLPALSLSALMVGYIARMTRSSMLEVMRLDYIRTAYAKGLSRTRTIIKHGLRNAMIPVITIIGLNFASLLGGAIATETIFAWPGIGTAMFDAINQRDLPVIEAGVIILSIGFVVVNIVVDVAYAFLDPRIRLE
jgi:ABC-type dipeptide/oligopeptide/nickel transport system permease component